MQAGNVAITRHIKIRGTASPYDPVYDDYFEQRAHSRRSSPLTWDGMEAETDRDTQAKPTTENPVQ